MNFGLRISDFGFANAERGFASNPKSEFRNPKFQTEIPEGWPTRPGSHKTRCQMGRSEKATGSSRGLLEDESEFETASNNRGSVAGNQWELNAQDLTKVLLSNGKQPGSVGHPKPEVRCQRSGVSHDIRRLVFDL